jgi:protein polybromo-1
MLKLFIECRDELCRHGDVLASPALNYTLNNLTSAVDLIKQEKLPKEQPEEDLEIKDTPAVSAATSGNYHS